MPSKSSLLRCFRLARIALVASSLTFSGSALAQDRSQSTSSMSDDRAARGLNAIDAAQRYKEVVESTATQGSSGWRYVDGKWVVTFAPGDNLPSLEPSISDQLASFPQRFGAWMKSDWLTIPHVFGDILEGWGSFTENETLELFLGPGLSAAALGLELAPSVPGEQIFPAPEVDTFTPYERSDPRQLSTTGSQQQSDLPTDEDAARILGQFGESSDALAAEQLRLTNEATALQEQLQTVQQTGEDLKTQDQNAYERSLQQAESAKSSHLPQLETPSGGDALTRNGGWQDLLASLGQIYQTFQAAKMPSSRTGSAGSQLSRMGLPACGNTSPDQYAMTQLLFQIGASRTSCAYRGNIMYCNGKPACRCYTGDCVKY